MKTKILIGFSIFFLILSILVLANPDIYQRRPNTYVVGDLDWCTGETNAYHYDGSYMACTVDSSAAFNPHYFWNYTDMTSERTETINDATFGVYFNCTGGGAGGSKYNISYGFSSAGNCSTNPPAVWYNISDWINDECPFAFKWKNVTNVTEVNWTNVNNTCWMIQGDKIGGGDDKVLYVDAFHVDVDYQPPAATYCSGEIYTEGSGAWTISVPTTCEDEVFDVNGYITIQATGELHLVNTTLSLASTSNNTYISNSNLLMINDSSNVTTNASDIYYRISGSGTSPDMHVNDSYLERIGTPTLDAIEFPNTGALMEFYFINSTAVTVDNQFDLFNTDDIIIYNSTITGSTYLLNLTNVEGANISDNILTTTDDDLFTFDDVTTSVIEGNTIDVEGAGEYAFTIKILNWFNTTNITDNTITTATDGRCFYSSSGYMESVNFLNNDWYCGSEGIYQGDYAVDLNFTSEELWKIGSASNNLFLLNMNNSHIFNVTVYNTTNYALYLDGYHNNISDSTFIGTSSSDYAVSLMNGENNTFFNNNITSDGYGLYLSEDRDFILNNDLKADDRALWLNLGADLNNISWNFIESSGTFENATFIWSDHNLFYNNTHDGVIGSAMRIYGGNNNSFYEDILESFTLRYDYQSNGTGSNNFFDVSFNKLETDILGTSSLLVYWSVVGNVTDESATPLQDANVTAWNSTDIAWWNLTNATGYTNWTFLQEYNESADGRNYQTNFTFNATLGGYTTSHEEINLTYAQTQVNITMTTGIQTLSRVIYDTSGTNDYIFTLGDTNVEIYDSSSTNDYILVSASVSTEIYDSSTAVDYVTITTIANINRFVYDTSGTNDYITIDGEGNVNIYDASAGVDYVDTSGSTAVSIYDTSGSADYVSRSVSGAITDRSIYDTAGTSDYVSRTINATIVRSIYDTAGTADYIDISINASLEVAIYDTAGTADYVTRSITMGAGILNITLITPPELTVTQVNQNDTFWLNSSIECLNSDCGDVDATARRNSTTASPDLLISTTPATPMYIVSGNQPQTCSNLLQDETCYLNWSINATNFVNSMWAIDVNATGLTAPHNHSQDAWIYINATGIPPTYVPDVVVCMNTKNRKVCINIRTNTIFIYPKE